MNNMLRKVIRQLILERSQQHADMMEWWYNRDEGEAPDYDDWADEDFTKHRDMLRQNPANKSGVFDGLTNPTEEQADELFKSKRDLKRYWNENCDRKFWESGKVQFFHSLLYYGGTLEKQVDELGTEKVKDRHLRDMSIKAFFDMYGRGVNKDELSTYGIYKDRVGQAESLRDFCLGVLVEGRVTFAHRYDAWVESRSKATKADMAKHKGSGLPKRMTPRSDLIDGIVFNEEDVKEVGLGEVVVDNWKAIAVCVGEEDLLYEELDIEMEEIEKQCEEMGLPFVYGDFRY